MPTVPRIEIPSGAGISAGSGVFSNADRAATPEAFGAGIGRAEEGLGRQIEHAGDVMQKHANLLQDRANQAAATDMFVNWDKEASLLQNWHRNQMGKNATDTLTELYKKQDELREKFTGSAPNLEVRRMFDQDSKRRLGYMISDAAGYAANQNKQYNLKQAEARTNLGIQNAGNAKSEEEFKSSLTDVRLGAIAEAREYGQSDEAIQMHIGAKVDKAWEAHIATVAQNEPFLANNIYQKNKGDIADPGVRLRIEQHLKNQYDSVGTRIVSHAIENGAPIPNLPPSIGTNREAIGKIESGGRYDALGPVVPSGTFAGQRAVGKYQVMEGNIGPWTEEVLGKRLTPEEFRNDKAAQDAVFDAKFGQLVEKYGNPQDAASAWHSGRPLAQAVKEGARDVNISTSEYVNQFNAALGQGAAEPLTQHSGADWLANATVRAKEAAQKLAPDNPNFEDLLVRRVQTAFNNVQTMTRRVERENYNEVKGALLEVDENGRPKITSMDQILDNPALNQRYTALDKAGQNAVQGQVTKNSRVDTPMTDANYKRFQELQGQSTTDPAKFLEADIMSEDMPRTLKSQLFAKQRALEKSKQDTTGLTRALSSVTPMLNDAGIRRSATDTAIASRYNQFVGAFQTERDSWIKDHGGKAPSDKENQTIAAGVLRVANPDRWFFQGERMGFEVPDDSKTEISKAFSTRYGRPPTASETYQIYQRQLKRESDASK